MAHKIIAQSGKKVNGLLPMKQSPELESKKSKKQKNEELCNFIKNAFIVDGNVMLVELDEEAKVKVGFLLEDSKRKDFMVFIK